MDFCADDIPAFFAIADGLSWKPVTGNANGAFTVPVGVSQRLFMVWQRSTSFFEIEVVNGSRADLQALAASVCVEESGTRSLSGTVAGISTSETASASMGDASALIFGFNPSRDFVLSSLAPGPLDLIASREAFPSTSR